MKEKLAKLIDVKSIVTLLLTVVFCVLCITSKLPTEFLTIYTVIIGFYFGTQAQKKADAKAAAGGYTRPAQAVLIADSTEPIHETVDAATTNDVHPPDTDATAKVGFEH